MAKHTEEERRAIIMARRHMLAGVAVAVVRDLLAVCGASAVTFGFWRAWEPLGMIVGGSFLLALGLSATLRARAA